MRSFWRIRTASIMNYGTSRPSTILYNLYRVSREINFGGFEADVEKHPTGVFFREGGENGGLLLSFSIAKKKEGKKLFAKGVSRLAGSVQQSYVQQS